MHQATETFLANVDGVPVTVVKGENVDSGHELVKRFPQWFRKAESRFAAPEVEQATAGPGEKRGGKPSTDDE